MTLGAAIFASVVLVLLVYNKPFRKASAWVAGVLAGIILVGGLGWYAYGKYQDYSQAKQVAAHKKLVDACVARFSTSDYRKTNELAPYLDLTTTCENNPNIDWNSESKSAPNAPYSKVVEIHDGDTLTNASGVIPLVYMRHGQKMVLACKDSPTGLPTVKKGIVSCPDDESAPCNTWDEKGRCVSSSR
jgi:hypothetical protein